METARSLKRQSALQSEAPADRHFYSVQTDHRPQLGFGFTLIGVGGLFALNRSADLQVLRTGVRTGALESVLFPSDVVANMNRIISDLSAIFPITKDHAIILPMGKLGWGTPTLISLELGIMID